MQISKEYFKDFKFPNEQSSDTLNFYANHHDLGVSIPSDLTDYLINTNPLVSILMTTYNRQEYVIECIKSILKQSYKNIEFIIVDDNSDDDTEYYIRKLLNAEGYTFTFIKTEGKRGPGLNKRLGWDYVKGQYVIFLDDDDYYVSNDFILKSIKLLLEKPELAVVGFNSYMGVEDRIIISDTLYPLNTVINSTMALYKFMISLPKPNSTFPAVFNVNRLKIGDIAEMKILNDTQIWLRALLSGNLIYLSDYVGVYRVHKGSIGYKLTVEEIINNLDEKTRIYNNNKFPFKDTKWLVTHVLITLKYYFSKNRRVKFFSILTWTLHNFNIQNSVYILINCLGIRIKYYLKRLLRRQIN